MIQDVQIKNRLFKGFCLLMILNERLLDLGVVEVKKLNALFCTLFLFVLFLNNLGDQDLKAEC